MPDILFLLSDGREIGFEAPAGVSLMQAATGHGIDGIVAECGGSGICATCHVYVDPAWADQLLPPEPHERDMLEVTAAVRRPTSRLSCQIRLDRQLQGLRVEIPDRQY